MGRKGDPYRYRRILRSPAAQHSRRNAEEAGSFLVRPRSGHQKETADSSSPLSAPCAESVHVDPADQARLDDLATRYPEAA